MKRVVVAPFELKLGPNESYGRAASVGTPPRAKNPQIQAKIIVKLPIHRPGGRYVMETYDVGPFLLLPAVPDFALSSGTSL